MTFLSIPHDRSYYTGAVHSNLSREHIAKRLARNGVTASIAGSELRIAIGDDNWVFDSWESDGLGATGWLRMAEHGDVNRLSRTLASSGFRHRLDHSRPLAIDVTHVRCVTRYCYRWNTRGMAPSGPANPEIETYEEPVAGDQV